MSTPILPWGVEAIYNFGACHIPSITNKEHVENFARALVVAIDMVAYGDPQVVNFGSGNKAGFTLVQLIETSNITAHFCNETGDVYLNVFSCKDFDPQTVINVFSEYFNPLYMESIILDRQAPQTWESSL